MAWTQTTNGPTGADVYRLTLQGDGYVLDGKVRPFEVEQQTIKVRQADGSLRDVAHTIRRTVHGPTFSDRRGVTVALRVVPADRPKMFEQFWRMGLAKNFDQWRDAMRMQQLPIFHTMYADRDGHIMYVYNAAPPVRAHGDHAFWNGVIPGDRSELIPGTAIVPFDQLPQAIDPPSGWVQNSNDSPWTSTYPTLIDTARYAAYIAPPPAHTQRSQRGVRLLSESGKISLSDLKAMKLSTKSEIADHFVDDLVAAAKQHGSIKAKEAADILAKWDRQGETASDGTLLFLRFVQGAGNGFQNIGGVRGRCRSFRQPLTTPRWVRRSRQGSGLAGSRGAPSRRRVRHHARDLGRCDPSASRPARSPRQRPARAYAGRDSHDQHRAVRGWQSRHRRGRYVLRGARIPENGPPIGEALLGYGNWSRVGSKHVDDQLALASQKKMRPIVRSREVIEKNLENRTTF